ncbi:MerR family transcriptional regulator [Paractinoplanes rhizophilus]|uniref:MerR family transcriptional regulator n=1 Tax=Paractinoplanes rhizophilus TaxID=1416877 RepID=A0ABW2HIY7_9ACTN
MWTMDELVERVREALAAEYSGAPNGRVRDVPDRRAIRWYTTIGLVDRPLGMRGRTALYGPRHLQQLVAIKRRQAEGRSLAEIQADFARLTPEGLADASRIPAHLLATGDPPGAGPDRAERPRFWADRPATGTPAAAPDGTEATPAETEAIPAETGAARVPAAPVHGVTLGGGAILLLPRPVSGTDRAAIAEAAAPLLRLLESRGLIDGRTP